MIVGWISVTLLLSNIPFLMNCSPLLPITAIVSAFFPGLLPFTLQSITSCFFSSTRASFSSTKTHIGRDFQQFR